MVTSPNSDFSPTAENINALPDKLRDYIHHLETECDPAGTIQENFNLRENVHGLNQWVSDLQSGMYINCVYCGHRYGPDPGTPIVMADILKDHIVECHKHPLSIMVKRNGYLLALIRRMQRGIKMQRSIKMLNNMVNTTEYEAQLDVPWDAQKECNRASGEGLCDVCRQPLKTHLMPMPEGCPSMIEDCNGDWWKL